MKITEQVTRECCHYQKDLKVYTGQRHTSLGKGTIHFCTHCGQVWHYIRKPGEMDAGLERLVIADGGES
jgi:hypothetical protein